MSKPKLRVRKARWVDPADERVTKPWWFKVICDGVTRVYESAHDGREALVRGLVALEHHSCPACRRATATPTREALARELYEADLGEGAWEDWLTEGDYARYTAAADARLAGAR